MLALAACSSTEPEVPPAEACPAALLLDGAERTSVYRDEAAPRPDELRYIAVLTDLSSSCRYYSDDTGQGVEVDLSFKLIAERGPALSGSEEVTYFVATVGPGNQIFSRDVLSGDLPLPGIQSGSDCPRISPCACRRSPPPKAGPMRCMSVFSWTTPNWNVNSSRPCAR